MTNRKTSRSMSKHAKQAPTATQAHPVSDAGTAPRVPPTSERIIRETSVKRRKAVEALANR